MINTPNLKYAAQMEYNRYLFKCTDTHLYFYKGVFSQWFPSRFKIGDQEYNCAEQWMMERKARHFGDLIAAERILKSDSPGEMQKIGRLVKNYDEEEWKRVRFDYVVVGNFAKFTANSIIQHDLTNTKNLILVEGSPYDHIWGVGLGWDNPLIEDEANWQGLNLLGKALVEVRERL